MRYYKIVINGCINSVGIGAGGSEITEAEYNDLLSAIHNRPQDTQEKWHRLREDLTWEEYDAPPVEEDTEASAEEIVSILTGGAL